jgi:hypothetical protein
MDGIEIALLHRDNADPLVLDLASQFSRLLDREKR